MKNIVYVMVVLLTVVSCQKTQKIGYIDNGKVINEYQSKKDIESKYQAKDAAFQKRADSIGQAFQLEAQEFQTSAKSMSPNAQQEKYQQLGQKQQTLKQQLQFEQQQIQQAFQTEIDTLIVEVKDFVKDYGKKNGYTYILGTSDAAATVLYGTDENDLTQTILDALNKEYKK
ncbi:MAG: OmpH family outer membrane protein [Flavobacteriales bacterium]|nr:OmpH family outer membrane protein [Flavobacteriales bacterium]NCP88835.1 OmpH family outer membrane protein [Flavobacteriales bacterium]